MVPSIDLKKLKELIQQRRSQERILVALAGPPGSGKSTLAGELESALHQEQPEQVMILPMDGFHYDDDVLHELGLLNKKGSPNTFDFPGFTFMLKRLFENREKSIAIPVFDRELEVSRNGSNIIESSVRHLIVEGNYLMLKEKP